MKQNLYPDQKYQIVKVISISVSMPIIFTYRPYAIFYLALKKRTRYTSKFHCKHVAEDIIYKSNGITFLETTKKTTKLFYSLTQLK
jgi:hypothetical protein